MTTLLGAVIITSDVFAALMLIIIALGVSLEKEKAKRNAAFIGCITGVVVCLCFEVCNYLFDGNPDFTHILYITNTGVSVVGDAVIFFLIKYCYDCVNEKRKTNRLLLYVVSGICITEAIIQTIGPFFGFTFTIENGVFIDNWMYTITTVVTLLCYVIISIFLFRNRKYMGKHLFRVFVLYFICPIIAVIILIIEPRYYFILQSLALSFLIVYIGIEKQEKENLLTVLANEDTLTGLYNRNSWNTRYEELLKKNCQIAVVYADLNGLKHTNDNYGHLAGDKLIMDFTEMLRSSFKTDNIYRIGGDEFVIYFDSDLDKFESKMETFKKAILENNRIGSYGYRVGDSSDLENIIRGAESDMYKDKNDYYKTSGVDRRKR